MEWISYVSIAITILGFLLSYASLSRKMVLKEDLQAMVEQLTDLSERTVNLEKTCALLEYRIGQLENKN